MSTHRPAYFSHDADARNDVKCLALRQKHGYEGYGIFWAIIEVLRTQPNYSWDANALHLLCICIACDMQLLTQVFDTCIKCGLLTITEGVDGTSVTSPSLHRRMAAMEEISEKRREAAKKRHDANALQLHSKSNANAPKHKLKVKEKITPLPPEGFDVFYAAYPLHVNRADAVKAYTKLNPNADLLDRMLEAIRQQTDYRTRAKAQGKFAPEWPHPSTWLNNRRWEDELVTAVDTGIHETSHLPMWAPGQCDV